MDVFESYVIEKMRDRGGTVAILNIKIPEYNILIVK